MFKSKWKRYDMIISGNTKFLIYFYIVINLAESSSIKNIEATWNSQLKQADGLNTFKMVETQKDMNATRPNQNPYPVHCPRGKNMTKLQMEENHICILRRKWYDELSNITKDDSAKSGRRSAHNLKQFVSQRPYANPDNKEDCLKEARKTVRYFPGNCYSKQYEGGKTVAAEKTAFENTWWNFAAEVLGDIMYTFDFVLWSSTPSDEYNQFWYLILYLKELATAYENPMDIVGRAYHEAYLNQLKEKLAAVKADLKKRQEDYRVLDHTLKELKITMGSYQNLMSELQNRMGKVVATLPFEQANQELLLYKLDNASEAASKLELLFRRSNINLPINVQTEPKLDEKSNIKDFPRNTKKEIRSKGVSDIEESSRRGLLVNLDKQSRLEVESDSEKSNRREFQSSLKKDTLPETESYQEKSNKKGNSRNIQQEAPSETESDRESSNTAEVSKNLEKESLLEAETGQKTANNSVHPVKIDKESLSDGNLNKDRSNRRREFKSNREKEEEFHSDGEKDRETNSETEYTSDSDTNSKLDLTIVNGGSSRRF